MNNEYTKITEKIDKVLLFLKDAFPEAELLYCKILPRSWWKCHARLLARWIDYYLLCKLRKTHKIKEVWPRDLLKEHYQFDEIVDYGMLCRDQTHLNNNGHKALVSGLMKPLLHKWKWAK